MYMYLSIITVILFLIHNTIVSHEYAPSCVQQAPSHFQPKLSSYTGTVFPRNLATPQNPTALKMVRGRQQSLRMCMRIIRAYK